MYSYAGVGVDHTKNGHERGNKFLRKGGGKGNRAFVMKVERGRGSSNWKGTGR